MKFNLQEFYCTYTYVVMLLRCFCVDICANKKKFETSMLPLEEGNIEVVIVTWFMNMLDTGCPCPSYG